MTTLPTIFRNQLVVLALPRRAMKDLFALVANTAVQGPLRVIDGGNLFNVLNLNRMIRRRTAGIEQVLRRVHISRAFTCFQMEAMLHDLHDLLNPILVIDLLNTFYDQSVSDQTSRRLLANCISHLKRCSATTPVMVSVFPPPKAENRPFLISTLLEAADHTWQWQAETTQPLQPALWE